MKWKLPSVGLQRACIGTGICWTLPKKLENQMEQTIEHGPNFINGGYVRWNPDESQRGDKD